METRLAAHYIFPIVSSPLKNAILILDESGTVLDLIDTGGELREIARLTFYCGVLIPEFPQLDITSLHERQQQMPQLSLHELLCTFAGNSEPVFVVGKKAGVYLLSGLDMAHLRVTSHSKLKKLV